MMRKVLLVDDEIFIRKGLRALIERSGLSFHYIEESDNGRNALEILQNDRFDLVVVDIRMPFMDGITMLKEAQKLAFKPYFIILSGYDDFNYAKEAIKYGAKDYLLKPVDRIEFIEALGKAEKELERLENASNDKIQIDNIFNKISTNELNYVLLNDNLTGSEIQAVLETLGIDIFSSCYQLAIIHVMENDHTDGKNHYVPISNCIETYFQTHETCKISFLDKDDNLVLIICGTFDYEDFVKNINDGYEGIYLIGVSGAGQGAEDFRKTYFQALEALKYRIVKNFRSSIFFDEINRMSDSFEINIELMKKIAEMVGTQRIDEINKAINQLFDIQYLHRKKINYVEETVEGLNKYVIEPSSKHLPHQDIEFNAECKLIRSVYNFDSIQEYIFSLKSLILKINDYLLELKKEFKEKSAIDTAIEWMNASYSRGDLTMTLVANQVSLNYTYFSLAFKEKTGMSFVNYLKRLRIEKSKELLRNADMKINEIARKVGFQSPRLFAKSFREEIGISPFEYSKKPV